MITNLTLAPDGIYKGIWSSFVWTVNDKNVTISLSHDKPSYKLILLFQAVYITRDRW